MFDHDFRKKRLSLFVVTKTQLWIKLDLEPDFDVYKSSLFANDVRVVCIVEISICFLVTHILI